MAGHRWLESGMASTSAVAVHTGNPPRVVGIGVGIHGGVHRLERWRLPDLYALHMYTYDAELIVDDVSYAIRPGHLSIVAPGSLIEYRFRGASEHIYAHLDIPRGGPRRLIPVIRDTGIEATDLRNRLRSAVSARRQPMRDAELWAVLCRLVAMAEAADAASPERHPALLAALSYLDANLAAPLTVPAIADQAGVSPGHLNRLFRAATGHTAIGYLRYRRMQQARHLLRDTTLSVAAIAAGVGIPDLQAFNKACRRELGASPRAVRSSASH